MNPVDLLVHQQRASRVLREAMPDAPQVVPRPRRYPVRCAVARLAHGLGLWLIRAGQRLQPSADPRPDRVLAAGPAPVGAQTGTWLTHA